VPTTISVTAVLNLDRAWALFELDIWKADFSPLQRLPEDGDVVEFRSTQDPGRSRLGTMGFWPDGAVTRELVADALKEPVRWRIEWCDGARSAPSEGFG
jgi:hypothetical protein